MRDSTASPRPLAEVADAIRMNPALRTLVIVAMPLAKADDTLAELGTLLANDAIGAMRKGGYVNADGLNAIKAETMRGR